MTYLDFLSGPVLGDPRDPEFPVVHGLDDAEELVGLDLEVVEHLDGGARLLALSVAHEEIAPVRPREVHHQPELVDLAGLHGETGDIYPTYLINCDA